MHDKDRAALIKAANNDADLLANYGHTLTNLDKHTSNAYFAAATLLRRAARNLGNESNDA